MKSPARTKPAARNALPDLLAAVADRDARITGLEALLCDAQAEVESLRKALDRMLAVFDTPDNGSLPGAEQETCRPREDAMTEAERAIEVWMQNPSVLVALDLAPETQAEMWDVVIRASFVAGMKVATDRCKREGHMRHLS